MISISAEFVMSAAPNAAAANNGRGLVLKNKFVALHHSSDETFWFGECQGSGSKQYLCSADFSVRETPVYRCSCPSRQFPCKHSLGLLYAIVEGKKFTVAAVPPELATKREKTAARTEKRKVESEQPRQVNKSALAKKIKSQLEGIDLLERLTQDVVKRGIGNMNAKTAHELEEQAKQLGNAYLPGAQMALRNFSKLFNEDDAASESAGREGIYSEALDELGSIYALVGKGRAYLTKRLEDPELTPETDTPIAAWLGHAWQLRELKDAGLVEQQVELVQLAFHSYDDVARKEYVDTGVWMQLANGRIGVTKTYRPYKAARHIKSDDSFQQVAEIPELCIYPGGLNPRIRWEGMTSRPITPPDLQQVRRHGRDDFANVIKEVKSHLKNPLAEKHPIFALNYRSIGAVDGVLVLEDERGERLVITDAGMTEEPRSSHLLALLSRSVLQGQTLIARFRHDLDARKLQIKPLSIVTASELIRLTL